MQIPDKTYFALAVLALLVSLSGCTHIQREVEQPLTLESQDILSRSGVVHVDDVLHILGPPQKLSALPGGYVFLYQRIAIVESQFGISSNRPILKWLKFSIADADVLSETLVLQFGIDDVLMAGGFSKQRGDIGDSSSIMHAFSVSEIIDSSGHTDNEWTSDRWALGLLQDLPVGLNRQHSPDSGNSGMELTGTPKSAGQRTLEKP